MRVTDGLTYSMRMSASRIPVTSSEFSISARKRVSLPSSAATSSAVRSSTRRSSSSSDRSTPIGDTFVGIRASQHAPTGISAYDESWCLDPPNRGSRSPFRRTGERSANRLEQALGRVRLPERQRLPGPERLCQSRRSLLVELREQEVDRAIEPLGQPQRSGGRGSGNGAVIGIRQDLEQNVAQPGVALDDDDRLTRAERLGEKDRERRAGAPTRCNRDRAAALLRDPVSGREAEADAPTDVFRREERLEEMLDRRLVDAGARVFDREN